MPRLPRIAAALLALGCAAGCGTPPPPPRRPSEPQHRMAVGGDTFFGRDLAQALFTDRERRRILEAVAPLLRGLDLLVVNAEGVIAEGGAYAPKGEPCPYAYRAHPRAMDVLVEAGVDVVTVGNNHSGDYGPLALREMLDRLRQRGLDYAGGGLDAADAARPAYRRVGDTVVAIVGADLTGTCAYRAGRRKPGIRCYDASKASSHDGIVAELAATLRTARRHAQVVVLCPHWGRNRAQGPTPATRALAKRLIDAGYDAIVGHSAHWVHGIELFDGRPVVYDVGNFLVDYAGRGRSREGALVELRFGRSGVTEVLARPLDLSRNRTRPAPAKASQAILDRLQRDSKDFGTKVAIRNGAAIVRCDPGEARGPASAADPPARPVPREVRLAPKDYFASAVPPDVCQVRVAYPNGVELLGAAIPQRQLPTPISAMVVDLFMRTGRSLPSSLVVEMEARSGRERQSFHHLPGDNLLPGHLWPIGQIVHDRSLMRLRLPPRGRIELWLALRQRGARLEPVSVAGARRDGPWIAVGDSEWREGAPDLFEVLGKPRSARPPAGLCEWAAGTANGRPGR